MIQRYLNVRKNLIGVILLIDIRREPGKEEFELLEWLSSRNIPSLTVLTKADKLSRQKQQKKLAVISKILNRQRKI